MSYFSLLYLLIFSIININILAYEDIDDGFSCESVIKKGGAPLIYFDSVGFSAKEKIKKVFILDNSDALMGLDCIRYDYISINYYCHYSEGLTYDQLEEYLNDSDNRIATLHAVPGISLWMLDYNGSEQINMNCELGERVNMDYDLL